MKVNGMNVNKDWCGTQTSNGAMTTRLVELLRTTPSRDVSYRGDRLEWLLNVADALDSLHVDGAAELAASARSEALALVEDAVRSAGQGTT